MLNRFFSYMLPFSKEAQTTAVEVGVFLVVICLVVVMQITGVQLLFVGAANNISRPLLQMQLKVVSFIVSSSEMIKQQHQLVRRVQDLELRLSEAAAGLGELDQLRKENEELRKLLNSGDRSLGRVVLTQPILSYAQPVIGLPKNEEISPGIGILVEGTLVGIIKEINQEVAVVDLLWQRNVNPVLAATDTGVAGLVVGDGKRVLLTEVQADEELEIGQRVITTGQKGIDRGVLIGVIRSLQMNASDATKTAVIEQFVSFYDAQLVEIKL